MRGDGGGICSDGLQDGGDYVVKFYDVNLDLNYSLNLTAAGTIDLPTLIDEYDLSIALYEARDDIDLALETTYPVTNSINLYGVPNVKEITNETELSNIKTNYVALARNYILMNDITLTSTTLDDTEGWSPIGDSFLIRSRASLTETDIR
ncbi:MAG: hypothetical protein LBI57_07900 [Helicobacteraceae bacterium]|nr:hypothetical protein [Helicobacteraceae bacterium]